jgi:quercetin dioxygenase-like cupin family protein
VGRDVNGDGYLEPSEQNQPPPDFSGRKDGVPAGYAEVAGAEGVELPQGLPERALGLENVSRRLDEDGWTRERYDRAREHEFRVFEIESANARAFESRASRVGRAGLIQVKAASCSIGHNDGHGGDAMINVFNDVPYKDTGMGNRKLVDEKSLLVMQIALRPEQMVPLHEANSNAHMLVLEGELVVTLAGDETSVKRGDLLPIAFKTPMTIRNSGASPATFLMLKAPHPSEMPS